MDNEDLRQAMKGLVEKYTKANQMNKEIENIQKDTQKKSHDVVRQLDLLSKETDDFDTTAKRINQATALKSQTEEEFDGKLKAQKDAMEKLKENEKEKNMLLKEKEKALFALESQVETESAKGEAEHANMGYAVSAYKDKLYSGYKNNQERAFKDLKIQFEGITKCIDQLKTLNKDTQNIDELMMAWGLNKTEDLLKEQDAPPYDEIKLREVKRNNDNLRHQIEQAIKEEDEQATKLIGLTSKNKELSNQLKLLENYQIVNEELKEDLQEQQKELRGFQRDEAKLREQNEFLTKQLEEKKNILVQKEAASEELVKLIHLAGKFLDMRTLNNEIEDSLRVLNDNSRKFRNEIKTLSAVTKNSST